jgi:hypothetical protein
MRTFDLNINGIAICLRTENDQCNFRSDRSFIIDLRSARRCELSLNQESGMEETTPRHETACTWALGAFALDASMEVN